MAFYGQSGLVIGTVPTLILSNSGADRSGVPNYILINRTASATIFLGGVDTITAAISTITFQWLTTDAPISTSCMEEESLYGIVAATPQEIDIFGQGT
jgi:hypothetical protein